MSQLEQDFDARIRAAIIECHRLRYYPSDFEEMLRCATAIRVAEKLVTSGELQSGLKRLAQLNRLDLSIEFIMLETQFQPLFKEPVLEAAQWRLDQVRPHQ